MALRTFLDSAGNEWQAFDVVPRADERRRFDRRSPEERRANPEDRRDGDRRLTVGGRSALASGVADGWLCFERNGDRRRLCPIPAGWVHCSDADIDGYCQSARPVRRDSSNAGHSAHGRFSNA
jgi:hypothetical protein